MKGYPIHSVETNWTSNDNSNVSINNNDDNDKLCQCLLLEKRQSRDLMMH